MNSNDIALIRGLKIIFGCFAVGILSLIGILIISALNLKTKEPTQVPVAQVLSPYITDFQEHYPSNEKYKTLNSSLLASFKDLRYGVECHIFKNNWSGNTSISCVQSLTPSLDSKTWLDFPFHFPSQNQNNGQPGRPIIERIVYENEVCYLSHAREIPAISCVVHKS